MFGVAAIGDVRHDEELDLHGLAVPQDGQHLLVRRQLLRVVPADVDDVAAAVQRGEPGRGGRGVGGDEVDEGALLALEGVHERHTPALPRPAPQRHGLHLPLGAGVGASVVGRSARVGSGGGREGRMGQGRRGESRGVGGRRRVDEREDGLGVADAHGVGVGGWAIDLDGAHAVPLLHANPSSREHFSNWFIS